MHSLFPLIALLLSLFQQAGFDRRDVAYLPPESTPAAAVVDEVRPAPDNSPAAVPIPETIEIEWSATTSGPSLTSHEVTVLEHYLVSEPWCQYCPAAKANFVSEGHNPANIINIAQARSMGEQWSGGIPYRFTRKTTKTIYQPPSYRTQWPPFWDVDGDKTPSKEKLLRHLRGNSNYAGKHWQQWHLESWSKEQLAALHSDDHNDTVKTYQTAEPDVIATVNGEMTADSIATVLSMHLSGEQQSTASILNIDINAPESVLAIARKLLVDQSWSAGSVSLDWKGGDRSLLVKPNGVTLNPPATVSLSTSLIAVSTSLEGVAYDQSLTWVRLELTNSPDLTIRFR